MKTEATTAMADIVTIHNNRVSRTSLLSLAGLRYVLAISSWKELSIRLSGYMVLLSEWIGLFKTFVFLCIYKFSLANRKWPVKTIKLSEQDGKMLYRAFP
jgi:hypothetical protein